MSIIETKFHVNPELRTDNIKIFGHYPLFDSIQTFTNPTEFKEKFTVLSSINWKWNTYSHTILYMKTQDYWHFQIYYYALENGNNQYLGEIIVLCIL